MLTLAQKAFLDVEGDIASNKFEAWAKHASLEFVESTERFTFLDGSNLFFDVDSKRVVLSGGYHNYQ